MPDDPLSPQPPQLTIDSDAGAVQSIALPASQRAEGVAFSATGDTIAVATADANAVLLFRRGAGGQFETAPAHRVEGADSRLNYPHDVAFGRCGDRELLAVAQRRGSIAIFERGRGEQNFGAAPTFEITGPKARLQGSDGVAFLPPDHEQLAVCNLEGGTITFYRMSSRLPLRFDVEPSFELKHPTLVQPDGLAFTSCGGWLATANHGNRSVSVFRRRRTNLVDGVIRYWSNPVSVIADPDMRYPHSVAFCPRTDIRRDQRGRQLFQHLHPDWPRTRPPLVATTRVPSNRRCRQRIPRRERDQQDGRRSEGRGCLREPPGDMHAAAWGEDLPTSWDVAGVARVAVRTLRAI